MQMVQKPFAPFQDILVSVIKVSCVPWVSNVFSGAACEVQKKMNFPFRVAAQHPVHVPDIPFVHPDQVVIFSIIRPAELDGILACGGDSVLPKFFTCSAVNGISDFLGACGGRGDEKVMTAVL